MTDPYDPWAPWNPAEGLAPDGVQAIHTRCLWPDSEMVLAAATTAVAGPRYAYLYSREQIERYRPTIALMLAELPDEFREHTPGTTNNGGWSFLNACRDRHGREWTGEHLIMERLFCLGLAAGLVRETIPRDLWEALPGGMPFYTITTTEENRTDAR